jgi:hypothetical protein
MAQIPLALCDLDSAQLITLVPVDIDVAVLLLDQAMGPLLEQQGKCCVPWLAGLWKMYNQQTLELFLSQPFTHYRIVRIVSVEQLHVVVEDSWVGHGFSNTI